VEKRKGLMDCIASTSVEAADLAAERKLRMVYERAAEGLKRELEALRSKSLREVVWSVLLGYELHAIRHGDGLLIPSLLGSVEREELLERIVDRLIETAR
jgi:hypothetical protein